MDGVRAVEGISSNPSRLVSDYLNIAVKAFEIFYSFLLNLNATD